VGKEKEVADAEESKVAKINEEVSKKNKCVNLLKYHGWLKPFC